MSNYYTANEIIGIAKASGISLNPVPSYNSSMSFKRFFTADGELFAKQAMSQLHNDASYFLCNDFAALELSKQ
jgi:hypothetical protein